MKNLVKLAVVAMAIAPFHAHAQVVDFNGSVTNTCTINVTGNGTLDASADSTQLASTIGSGTSGAATVSSTGPDFDLSAAVTTGVATADSDSTSMDVSGANSGSGVTTIALSNAGSNTVAVDYSATRAVGFSTGSYSSQVTLTCSE